MGPLARIPFFWVWVVRDADDSLKKESGWSLCMAGTFEGKVLQLHHLAVLQWAGVRCTLPGQSAMHCLCLGASGRTWMGGGKSVAPLRGAAWGARARYLMQRKEWVLNTSNALNHAQTDAQGCTGLNYLLAPLKPSSDCVGTVNYEIVQSLLSWTAKTYQTTEMQVEAGVACGCEPSILQT